MSINISDYNRNGVFIEEINNAPFDRGAAQEAVVNFVPGFSRKGTVFNRPILIRTSTDRNAYFGEIDRFLEKKGSYFHRTIDIALQSAPVYAMNLLKTNSLDTLNYASVSVSAQYDNDPVDTRQYDDFFNKSGFWQRDTESFLTFAQNSERMIHFTNVGDKKMTVFMFKSTQPGFDITAELWYGGKDKVPSWINYNSLISDYMVRVVAVSGDWSNYIALAADTNWSKYFNASGLRKEKVNDFIRDNAVTLLGDYNGSLIPYFRDNRNNLIFIETLINLDTDKTGLFCAYDIENVETDFHNGNVDIIGETLVGEDKSKINFMSYQDTIEEIDTYDEMSLDSLANVIGIGTAASRTTKKSNGRVTGLTYPTGIAGATPALVLTSVSGVAIINNTELPLVTTTLNFTALSAPAGALNSTYRIDTIYIDTDGTIKLLAGTEVESATGTSESLVGGLTYPATMPNNAIVLGYYFRELSFGGAYTNTYVTIAHNGASFISLTIGNLTSGADLLVDQTLSTNVLNITFNGTATATKANYQAWRSLLFFNELVTKKVLSNSVIIDAAGAKVDLTNAAWSDNYSAGTGDKYIQLIVANGIDIQTLSATALPIGVLAFYYNDNEFIMGTKGLETRATNTGTANYGIVAKNSEFYQDYYNGMINTGDYFFVKIAQTTSFKFVHYTDITNPTAIGNYIIMNAADATALGLSTGANNLNILIQSHPANKGTFSIGTGEDNLGTQFGAILVADGYMTGTELAFSVPELVATYLTTQTIDVYNNDLKVYLKMYTLGSTLMADFMADNTLITPYTIPGGYASLNTSINVFSGEASYEQTLEIETHPSYTITDNKVLIDLVRYPEVKVGDYVKAYVDNGVLQPGEYPKKFARILKKTPWANNTLYGVQYAEITTDIKIDISVFGTDLQTTRYTSIQDYIDTYKGIVLGGFTVQATSIPNGTETRQAEILNIIQKDSALYNAIVNKNKFNFRYLIDSFGLGLTEFSKQQLADITGKRKNCIGFLNMPSAKLFKDSSNPSFINTDGTLNIEYVKLGGNPEQNPAFLYSFAQGSGKDDGRDTVGYFFPYVTVNDNGRPLSFPPAAYIANTYMRKINSAVSGVQNWTVAAGIEDGRILGISNTEMDFTETDLENMYAMGANPIMYAKNVGFYIESEFTASITPLSALSFLHVREILIDLENELYAMLLKYQWKFNTPAVRAKIKREADAICQRYVDRSAIYAFENIIDDTNNTPIIIDNQFGLLETYIEPVKAMGTIVNVINIMPTGALGTSTGFSS